MLEQVGHTVNGVAIPEKELQYLANQIRDILLLSSKDHLLDLCCGNGYITNLIAPMVGQVSAIDFSSALIDVANTNNQVENTEYILGNVLQLDRIQAIKGRRFSKIMMFAALQHFDRKQFSDLLSLVSVFSDEEFRFLLGFLPNRRRRWDFYNSWRKRLIYGFRRISGSDVMGTWWTCEEIGEIAAHYNLRCTCIGIDEGRYGSHYRFHVLVHR